MSDWLVAKNLAIGYRAQPITSPFSFSIAAKEPVLAVIGRSGVGKTTLLHTLGGHLPPAAGTVSIFGSAPDFRHGDFPIVFQHYGLLPWKSAIENVELALKCQGVRKPRRRSMALALLGSMGLADISVSRIETLSGGMRQRVSLARALAANPKCLLLDEPFSALDAVTKQSIIDRLKEILCRSGICCVMVTHNLGDALDMAQNIILLRRQSAHLLINQEAFKREPRPEMIAMLQSALEQPE
jgi:ABC-type nitrate/sulfonate/bicarbonate transport system ATPase subunit